MNEYMNDRRQAALAAGLCTQCCKRPMAPNRKTCEPCLAKARKTTAHYRNEHPDSALNRSKQRRGRYLESAFCAKCGSREKLELDHIDPSTKVSHRIWDWSPERFEVEYAKCQWLCAVCHRRKTAAENAVKYGPPNYDGHGTRAGYGRGCRCDRCRAADNAHRKQTYERAKARERQAKAS